VALSKIPISKRNAERTLAVGRVNADSSETTICRRSVVRPQAVDLVNVVLFATKTSKLYVVP
jgi:hypothetical protein